MGEQAGRSLSTGLNGWMAAIQQSGRSAAELAAEYRLPEDYIAAVLQAELPPEGEEAEIEG
jgi:precorrin-3B C17-methyltransferase